MSIATKSRIQDYYKTQLSAQVFYINMYVILLTVAKKMLSLTFSSKCKPFLDNEVNVHLTSGVPALVLAAI
jgi:hypothetical protein